MARKTPDSVWEEVLQHVKDGMSNKDAAELAGISEVTLYAKCKEDSKFSKSLKAAQIEFKKTHVKNITTSANNGTWQASAWMLERKFNKEFGLKTVTELQGSDDNPLKIQIQIVKNEHQSE